MSSTSLEPVQRALLKHLINIRKRRWQRHISFNERLVKFMLEERRHTLNFWFRLLVNLLTDRPANVRKIWTKDRSSYWWDHIVNETWNDEEWKENFRMTKDTFWYINTQLEPLLSKKETRFRQPIPSAKRLAVTLWRLSTNAEYQAIAELFGVGQSTASKIVKDVCSAIVQILLPQYLCTPEEEELEIVVNNFEEIWGFPQCVGTIDRMHILIRKPKDNASDYFSQKSLSNQSFHSVVMQATVDHKYCFTSVNVGCPRSVYDSQLFFNSKFYETAENGDSVFCHIKSIHDSEVPLVLLGSSAYPLLPYLMKPYPTTPCITDKQQIFNDQLSRARWTVGNAFNMLKGRWKCLVKQNDINVEDLSSIILTCCVLHNICELSGDTCSPEWIESLKLQTDSENTNWHQTDTLSAVSIRDALADYFCEL